MSTYKNSPLNCIELYFIALRCIVLSVSVCLPVCLPPCLSACLSVCLSLKLSPNILRKCVSLSACLSACLFVCLPVCLPVCKTFPKHPQKICCKSLNGNAQCTSLFALNATFWLKSSETNCFM